MSSTSTKNILLSQSKIGQSEGISVPTLVHTTSQGEFTTEIRVEIPGIDPATVQVGFENNTLQVHCQKGELILPVNPSVDTSKIKADIMWGVLTLLIPLPEAPVARTIKVSLHDMPPTRKPAASKAEVE